MASSIAISRIASLLLPASTVAVGYGVSRIRSREWLKQYLSRSAKWKALVALILCLLNWKSLPFAWTVCLHFLYLVTLWGKSDSTRELYFYFLLKYFSLLSL